MEQIFIKHSTYGFLRTVLSAEDLSVSKTDTVPAYLLAGETDNKQTKYMHNVSSEIKCYEEK